MARFENLRSSRAAAALGLIALGAPLASQERIPIDLGPDTPSAAPEGPVKLDILAAPSAPETPTAAQARECDDANEAGEISGEIVVCRKLVDNSERLAGSYEAWLADYGELSKNFNAIPAPDVAGAGIFRGEPTVSGLCFIPPCPKDAALLIDVEALPPPPVGSDAYWQSLGLNPRGEDGELTPEARRLLEAELGLPPKPDFSERGEK